MFKNSLFAVLAGILLLTGCPGPAPSPTETPTTAKTGESVALGQTTSFLTLASACSGAPISYTYSGTTTPNYLASRDGQVTASGVFTAPGCGSALLGSAVAVTGSCLSGSIPHTAVASIVVGAEIVTAVTIVAADVSICGAALCRANSPLTISTPACPIATPTVIGYYARIDTSCGVSAFSPVDPATVNPIPPTCATTVSP